MSIPRTDRRGFLKTGAAAAGGIVAAGGGLAAAAPAPARGARPNILFIICDQLNLDAVLEPVKGYQ